MAEILNRMGYRLRKVLKAKPQKKIPETEAIFDNIQAQDTPGESGKVKRLSRDAKATVNIGEYCRGGKTRGDNQASDHDMGCEEKYIPYSTIRPTTASTIPLNVVGGFWSSMGMEPMFPGNRLIQGVGSRE